MEIYSCEPCRRNKLKCDGLNPCGRCSRTQRLCGYSDNDSPSRLAPEPQSADHAAEDQQNIAETLRMFEDMFSKLHPGVRVDYIETLQRKYASSSPCPSYHLPREPEGIRPAPPSVDISSSHNQKQAHDSIDSPQEEFLGTTPIPTASVTVFNQGKTREFRNPISRSR